MKLTKSQIACLLVLIGGKQPAAASTTINRLRKAGFITGVGTYTITDAGCQAVCGVIS